VRQAHFFLGFDPASDRDLIDLIDLHQHCVVGYPFRMSLQIAEFSVINATNAASGVAWRTPVASATPSTHKHFAHTAANTNKYFAAYGDCGTWSNIG